MNLTTTMERNSTITNGDQEHGMHKDKLPRTYGPLQQMHPLGPRLTEHDRVDGYTRWISQKFHPNGDVMFFPGNCIICHLSPDSALYKTLSVVYNKLAEQDFARLYTLLPPASWHMTVFEGVCDRIRKTHFWPEDVPLDASLTTCNALFMQKLARFDLGTEPPFRIAVEGWQSLEDGIAVRLVPAGVAEESRLRNLRDRLSQLLGIRHPTHDTYVFHVSVAYLLRHLDQQEARGVWAFLQEHRSGLPDVFELGAPEFCLFDDVSAYYRQLFLQRQK